MQEALRIFEEFLEHQKTKEEAQIELLKYLKSSEVLEKFDNLYKTIMSQPNGAGNEARAAGRQKSRPWSTEEDERLKSAVEEHGVNNWGTVSDIVSNGRTRSQCSQRWNRVINPKLSKANWTQEEETKLISAVEAYGIKAWTRVAAEFGNRSDVQCRFKYNFIMKKRNQQGGDGEIRYTDPFNSMSHMNDEANLLPDQKIADEHEQ